jgi:hypothetical protein
VATYHVHIYAIVRAKYLNVEADSPEAAIQKVTDEADLYGAFRRDLWPYDVDERKATPMQLAHTEYAEDYTAALVDTVEDPNWPYVDNHQWYKWDQEGRAVLDMVSVKRSDLDAGE